MFKSFQLNSLIKSMQKRKFWFKPLKWDKKLITLALESGFEAFYVEPKYIDTTKELAKIKVIAKDKKADLVIGKDVYEVMITSKQAEKQAIKHQGKKPVIIYNQDWTIIPLENLIAKTGNLIQHVHTAEQAKTAFETLEKGADGILLETQDPSQIKKMEQIMKEAKNEKIELLEAEIRSVENLTTGDRVVIDTASILKPGQGMLVGDSSKAMFLVYNENVKSPYCDPRPFRVNAGGAHAYIRMPKDKTKYVGEIKSGDQVLTVDQNGNTEVAIAGRVKIEKRPMAIVRGRIKNQTISLVLQNAETIRLTKKNGQPVSITKLKKGDKVLAYLEEVGAGRHFGIKIKETITEN
ncbi:MAG: 3-dehydroquinate synthase II [Candidatus Moranbacteria bacterium]|nr:3-dehydroquinate synthase II [Candidatus Moranbacteria bacterium]